MGCCGALTSSATGIMPVVAIPPEGLGQRYLQSGENVECWAARTQSTDNKAGAAGPVGKITTAAIAAGCDLSLTQSVDAVPPVGGSTTSWDAPKWDPEPKPGINWSASGNNGKFTGKFDPSDENKDFKVEITAHFSDGSKDTKLYNIKPVKCKPGDDAIQLTNPMPGGICTAPFGEIRDNGTRGHRGLDFAGGGAGRPCVAAADGVVLTANGSGRAVQGFTGYGNYVLIQHKTKDGKPVCNTFYAHLESVSVTKDAQVGKGQTIGIVGKTGGDYPIHLHFELHVNGAAKDPLPYIHPKPSLKAGQFNKPTWNGGYGQGGGLALSGNYGANPAPGKTSSGTDGYQTASDSTENANNAIHAKQSDNCANDAEPPLDANDPDTPVVGNDPPCVDFLTLQQLQKAMPTCGNKCNVYLPHFNETIKRYVINDLSDKCGPEARKRVAMFLAQCSHESGDLRHKYEIWGPTSQQLKYDRIGAGNNGEPGSGYKYRGRGAIQLTGKSNYAAYAKETGKDLLANPDLVAEDPELYIGAAGFFWRNNKLNSYSNDINGATKRINGGSNGIADREKRWANAKNALVIA